MMTSPAGHLPLSTSPRQDAVLDRIASVAEAAGSDGVGVFDLDGCLLDNRHRQVRILQELASQTGWHSLHRVEPHHIRDWDLRSTLTRAGVDAALMDAHYGRIRGHWFRHFFRSEACLHDRAMPGAASLVRACAAAGLAIVYLTARHEEMRPGTERSLRDFGFPLHRPRHSLIMKTGMVGDDTTYKAEASALATALGRPVLFLDNEPRNVNLYRERFPEALTVFLATDHSPEPDLPHADIPQITGFLRSSDLGDGAAAEAALS